MKHLQTFSLFESIYNSDVPSWIRFEKDSTPNNTRVHYGMYVAGNVDTRQKFFDYLDEHKIFYEKLGINSVMIPNDDADRLRLLVKPGSQMK